MNIVVLLVSIASISIPLIIIGMAFYALDKKRHFTPILHTSIDEKHCTIILPCKGNNPELEENIKSFFQLDYKNYEVIIVVESEEDTAVPVIRSILTKNANGRLIIAGINNCCGQKNHNLVTAVDSIANTDILIFADSDIKLFPEWIGRITSPLIEGSATAVTGFRWLYPIDNQLGDLAHSLQNFILYSTFVTAAYKVNTGLWGGSMAIRKEDFDRLDVRSVWLRTSVDDMSLSEILKKKGETTLFAYDCITPTSDTIKSLRGATRWFERQVMYLKAHQRPEWTVAVISAFIYMGSYLLLPYAFIQWLTGNSFLLSGGIAWVLQTLTGIIFSFLFPVFGQKGNWGSFIIASPISFVTAAIATIRTLFTNKIIWSGFRYTIRFKDGTVSAVESLQ